MNLIADRKRNSYLPLASGLVSLAGDHCVAPPAARGALPESPQAEDKQTDIQFYGAFYDCRKTELH